mgnify:FL=1
MLTRWTDLDRTFSVLDDFQRRMNRVFADVEGRRRPGLPRTMSGSWPPINLYDRGEEIEVHALVPGVTDKNLNLTAHQDVLTISGEREVHVPEGYSVHRQERGGVRFTRTLGLPCKCDLERVSATIRDGMLTLKLAKAPEAQPRQITVTSK